MRRLSAVLITLLMAFSLAGCDFGIQGDVKNISSQGSGHEITMDEAVEIALNQVKGAKAEEVDSIKEGEEDGFMVYQGRIVHNRCTYTFRIDSGSGNIISWMVVK